MADITSWMAESVCTKPSDWTHERKEQRRDPTTAQLREMNKRLRTIYGDAGLNYGDDVGVTEITEKFKVAVNLRKRNVKNVLQQINKSKNVEVCFLVDATGSMGTYIAGVKNSINQIVRLLKTPQQKIGASRRQRPTANKLRLSFVAYRDHSDAQRFEVLNFTEDILTFTHFCTLLKASGGADAPEDVFGGINMALNDLDWSDDCGTKVIFHIADAPSHGVKFHDCVDNYPHGDPNGLTEEELFTDMKERGIDYYFGKINNSTNKMLNIFSKVYGEEIVQFDINDVMTITNSVFTAVSTSIFFSTTKNRESGARKTLHYDLVKEIPNWNDFTAVSGRLLDFKLPESIEDVINDVPLIRNQPRRAIIQIAPNPFAHGAERYAFYGRDVTQDENIVLKEHIIISSGNSAARYECANQIQTVASFFAQQFNHVFYSALGFNYCIKFLKVQTLCLSLTGGDYRYLSCEKQYSKNDKFVRFTNNADFAILDETAEEMEIDVDFVWALTAFSHWTYYATKGKLMVVDLQGIITKTDDGLSTAILTDPAIHCIDETRFGRMNLGKEGMEIFFKRHDCNKYCKALGLLPVLVDGGNECF